MKKNKKVIIWIVVILIIIVGSFYYFSKPKDEQDKYVTAKVIKTDVIQTVSVTGEVIPVDKANLSFETSGTVEAIFVKVGDKVKKGDKIAKINSSVMKAQLNEASLELNRQEEILKQARRSWDDLSPDEKKVAKLLVEKARASVWTIQSQVKKNTLYSPIDGIIIKKYIDKGELATITSPVVTVMGEEGIEIRADIPESDITKIKLGQKAEVTFDAFSSDEIFEVEVSEIEPMATIIQDVVYYETKFKIGYKASDTLRAYSPATALRAGMSADIDIATAKKDGVLGVPRQAIKIENENKYVEILIGEGLSKDKIGEQKEIKKVDIKIGLRGDDGMVEIISGLNEGDEIITFVKEK